jgi:hypothetical protein
VLADVASNNFTVLRTAVGQDVLDEVVSKLIASNCNTISTTKAKLVGDIQLTIDQRHTRAVRTTFADPLQVSIQEFSVTNFETLLDNLGGILIHAVLSSEAQDVVDRTTTISGSTVFTNVLNAPVAKLTMGNHINTGENFIDTGALSIISMSV